MNRIAEFAAVVGLAAVSLALIGEPATAPAAVNVAPTNPAPHNDSAMRAEIARLVAANQSLAAELAAARTGSSTVERPASGTMPAGAGSTPAPRSFVSAPACANGSCAVPRAVVKQSLTTQQAAEGKRFQRQRRFGGADGKVLTIFK